MTKLKFNNTIKKAPSYKTESSTFSKVHCTTEYMTCPYYALHKGLETIAPRLAADDSRVRAGSLSM